MLYRFLAGFYDIGTGIYFKNNDTNPRNIVANLITDKDKSVLDLCAGTCQNSIKIAEVHKHIKVTAIDCSDKMLTVAERKIKKNQLTNIETRVMDATNLDIKDKSFDVVVISLVLHEMSEGLQGAILKETNRVLKNNGKLMVVEWSRPITFGKKIKFSLIDLIESDNYMIFMKQDMKEYFNKAGFVIENVLAGDYTKVYQLKKL